MTVCFPAAEQAPAVFVEIQHPCHQQNNHTSARRKKVFFLACFRRLFLMVLRLFRSLMFS